jgi:hypothetical protein
MAHRAEVEKIETRGPAGELTTPALSAKKLAVYFALTSAGVKKL